MGKGGKRLLIKLELMLSNGDGSDHLVLRKGLTMGGFFRILLGGAVGAVLGILFVKKRMLSKPGERADLPVATPGPAQAPLAAPASQAPPAPAQVPVAPTPVYFAAPAQVPVAPPLDAPPVASVAVEAPAPPAEAPEAAALPIAVPIPAPAPVRAPEPLQAPAPAPVAEAPAPVAPPVETPPVASVAVEVPAPAPVAEVPAALPEPPVTQVSEYVAPVTPPTPAPIEPESAAEIVEPPVEVLEPPVEEVEFPEITGADGGPTSEVLLTPQVLDEPLPGSGWESTGAFLEEDSELEDLLPVVPDSVLPYEGPMVGDERSTSDDEAWRAAGWPEIAQAAVADSVGSMPEDDWAADWPAATPETAEPVVETAPLALEEEETPFFEPAAASSAPGIPEDHRPEFRTAPVTAADEEALGEDLKSRIEETRRRIREELEKPFAAVDDESPATEPVRSEKPAMAPAYASTPTPVIGEAMRVTPAAGNVGTPALPETPAEAVASENGADYDAMRSRIELTRSRLKAKAFDAMISGESALLGRDSDDAAAAAKREAAFDSEIEHTVDTTLREEDR